MKIKLGILLFFVTSFSFSQNFSTGLQTGLQLGNLSSVIGCNINYSKSIFTTELRVNSIFRINDNWYGSETPDHTRICYANNNPFYGISPSIGLTTSKTKNVSFALRIEVNFFIIDANYDCSQVIGNQIQLGLIADIDIKPFKNKRLIIKSFFQLSYLDLYDSFTGKSFPQLYCNYGLGLNYALKKKKKGEFIDK